MNILFQFLLWAKIFGFFILCGPLSAQNHNVLYSLKDLEILEKEKNFHEFFKHAHDIRPSLRKKHWKNMVGHMAEAFLATQKDRPHIEDSFFSQMEKIFKWPTLKNNEFFRKDRALIGEKYFKRCFIEKRKNCLKKLYHFWFEYPKDPLLGIKLHKLIHLLSKKDHQENHWTFFRPAVKNRFSEFYCKKTEVKKGILEYLTVLSKKTTTLKQLQTTINEQFHVDCIQSVAPFFYKKMSVGHKNLRYISYIFLEATKKIQSKDRDWFHLLYYLDGPVIGETFDQSLKTIKKLGKNYSRREKALKKIQTFDPLPGQLFLTVSHKKKKSLIEFFHDNVPEYMNLYAKACLDYLQEKRPYPKGNPTLQCRELVEMAKSKNYISPLYLSSLNKILNANK